MSTTNGLDTPPSKILVIDDNEANRALAKESLEDEGHTIVLADGGWAGVEAFKESPPDCVLLDVRMPDLDGFAVCERIRKLPGGIDTPIIFLTALRDVDTFDRALRSGGDDFLTKPIHPAELVARVHIALQLRHMRSTLRAQYEVFKQQRDALLRLQLEKERVIAFVVHDLKNPVNSIDLNAQSLLRHRALPAVVHDGAQQIRAASRQLNRMILDLLDVSKADSRELAPNRRRVEIEPLAASVADELQMAALARKVRIQSSLAAPFVFADEEFLHRIIANLVDNALRYTPVGSSVRVESRSTEGGVELRVVDAGHGVPPELRDKLFEPFVQNDREGALSAGTRGLGLAFCKRAVEAHGGRIWIEDANPGAAFCVFFPHES